MISPDSEKNLDFYAAKISQDIVSQNKGNYEPEEIENLVTKTLGVLQENGVYACVLYLNMKNTDLHKSVQRNLFDMTKKIGLEPPNASDPDKSLNFVSDHICNDLDTLLLTKQLWERILLYARYGAKAAKDRRI